MTPMIKINKALEFNNYCLPVCMLIVYVYHIVTEAQVLSATLDILHNDNVEEIPVELRRHGCVYACTSH